MTLSNLPVLAVQVAFTSTNLYAQNQTWTDISPYVIDFTTTAGRQHYLDRIEASTLNMTLDNRTGFFINGTTNGTGATLQTRCPIRVLAGWPQLNVTAISGSGTVVTYTCANTYSAGQQVIVQGATTAAFNGVFTVASATSTQFTVASTATGSSSTATAAAAYPIFTGAIQSADERVMDALNQDMIITASDYTQFLSLQYMSRPNFYKQFVANTYDQNYYTLGQSGATDLLSGNTGSIVGLTTNTQPGVLLYSNDTCLDLTNGGNGSNIASFQPYGNTQTAAAGNSIDFWFIGQQAQGQTILSATWNTQTWYMSIATSGELVVQAAVANAFIYRSGIYIADGAWHHIGLSVYTSGGTSYFSLYCDGAYTSIGSAAGTLPLSIGVIGNNFGASPLSAYINHVVIGNPTQTANNPNILNRWTAGKMLAKTALSGDRIAEVLILAGYGTITNGALVPTSLYEVNDNAYSASTAITSISGTGTTATATVGSTAAWSAGQRVLISGQTYSGSIASIAWAVAAAGPSFSITSAVGGGGYYTYTAPNASSYLQAGQQVTVTGNSQGFFNGTFTVYSASSTQFAVTGASSGSGTGGTAQPLLGTATVTMTAPHAYSVGTPVTITGSTVAAYNGTWVVQSVTSTKWTFISSYTSNPGAVTGAGNTTGASYYNGFLTIASIPSATTLTFASTGAVTVTGGTLGNITNGAFFVQGLQSTATSSTALDLIQQVTDTDLGAFFQGPDGIFEFDSQADIYNTQRIAVPTGYYVWTDQVTAGASYYNPSSLSIARDDADLWTTVQITPQNGVQQVYENNANQVIYGYSSLTKSGTIHATNDAAYQTAVFLGNLYGSPIPRVQNVELMAETNQGAQLPMMLNGSVGLTTTYLNDTVQFVRNQPGAWGSTVTGVTATNAIDTTGTGLPVTNISPVYLTFTAPTGETAPIAAGYLTNTTTNQGVKVSYTGSVPSGATGIAIYVTVGSVVYRASSASTASGQTGLAFAVYAPGLPMDGAINQRMVIEQVSHDFKADPGQWHTSYTLDPYPQRFAQSGYYFLVFDDPTYGQFDPAAGSGNNNAFL